MLTQWEKEQFIHAKSLAYQEIVKRRPSAAWDTQLIEYALSKGIQGRFIAPFVDERLKTKEFAKKLVSQDGLALVGFPKFNKDKDIIVNALNQNKAALVYVDNAIIEKSPNTIRSAIKSGADFSTKWMQLSEEFRNTNPTLLIDIIQSQYGKKFLVNSWNDYNFENIPKEILNNNEVAISAYRNLGAYVIGHLPEEKQTDERFILLCFYHATDGAEQLKILEYLNPFFVKNSNFLVEVYDLIDKSISKSRIFTYFNDPIVLEDQRVVDIVSREINQFSQDISFNVFSEKFFKNRLFNILIIRNTKPKLAIDVVDKNFLENDPFIVKELIKKINALLAQERNQFGVDSEKDAVDIINDLYSSRGFTFSETVRNDSELKGYFVAVEQFKNLPEESRNNKNVVKKFLKRDINLFEFIGKNLKLDKQFTIPYLEQKPDLVKFLPKTLIIDWDIIKTCLNKRYVDVLDYLPAELKERKDYVESLIQIYPGNFIDIVNKTPLKNDTEFVEKLKRNINWPELWQTDDIDYSAERLQSLKDKGIAKSPMDLGYNVNFNKTFPGSGKTSAPPDSTVFHISFFIPLKSLEDMPKTIFERGEGLGWHEPSRSRDNKKYSNSIGWIGGYVSKTHKAMWIDEVQSDLAQRTPTMRDPVKILNLKKEELKNLKNKLQETDTLLQDWKPETQVIKKSPVEGLQAKVVELQNKLQNPSINKEKIQEQINNLQKQIENLKLRESSPQQNQKTVNQQNPYMQQIEALKKQIAQKENEILLSGEDVASWVKSWDEFPQYHEFRSKIENYLKDWINQFFNTAVKLAKENGIQKLYLVTASEVKTRWIGHGTPASIELLKKIYDGTARKYGFIPAQKNDKYPAHSGHREIFLDQRNMWPTMKPDRFVVIQNGQETIVRGRYYPEFSDENKIAYVPMVKNAYSNQYFLQEEPTMIENNRSVPSAFNIQSIKVDKNRLKNMMQFLPRDSILDFYRTVPPVEAYKSIGGYWELDLQTLSEDKYAKNWIKKIKTASKKEMSLEEKIKGIIKTNSFCKELFEKFNIPLEYIDSKLKIKIAPLDGKYCEADEDCIVIDKKLADNNNIAHYYQLSNGETGFTPMEDFHFIVHELWHWLKRQKEAKHYFADPEEIDAFKTAIKFFMRTNCSRCASCVAIPKAFKTFLPLVKITIKDDKKAEKFLKKILKSLNMYEEGYLD